MKNVLSVRVDSQSLRRIRELAKLEKKEMSAVARELMDLGWLFLKIREYREGKISLSTLAHRLGVSLSEALDLLAEIGARSPIE